MFLDCEQISVPPLESVRHLILGSVYSNSGEIAKAKMHYISALREGELQGDVHTSAFASYELGMLLCKSNEVRMVLNCNYWKSFVYYPLYRWRNIIFLLIFRQLKKEDHTSYWREITIRIMTLRIDWMFGFILPYDTTRIRPIQTGNHLRRQVNILEEETNWEQPVNTDPMPI